MINFGARLFRAFPTLDLFSNRKKNSHSRQSAATNNALTDSKGEIAYLTETFFDLEDIVSTFRSFFILNSEICSVHRELKLVEASAWNLPDQFYSELILTRYEQLDGSLVPKASESLGPGADPRVISDGTEAYVVAQHVEVEPELKIAYRVINMATMQSTFYTAIEGMPLGKNWQPFLRDGRLFVLHSFSPLCVIELEKEGNVDILHQQETQLDIRVSHDNYTMFRGGSNGITTKDGTVYGFGHITIKNYKHNIFMWRLSPQWDLDIRISSETMLLNDFGYQICDPTGFFHDGSNFLLGFALSERDWFHGQKFSDLLLRLPHRDLETLFNKGINLSSMIETSAFSDLTQSLIPTEYETQIGADNIIGLRTTHAEVGIALGNCVFPGFHLDRAIEELEWIYRSNEEAGSQIGWLDVVSVEVPEQEEPQTALRTYLNGTDGKAARVTLDLRQFASEENISLCYHNDGYTTEIMNIRLKYNEINKSLKVYPPELL